MAYFLTRRQLRDRYRIENQRNGNSGVDTDTNINSILQYALNHTWEWLTSTDQGFGVISLVKTVAAGDVDGYIPGATQVNLPTDFRRVIELKRNNGFPDLVSHSEAQWRIPMNAPGWYLIGGPGQSATLDVNGNPTLIAQTIQFSPALIDQESITLVYAQQPPSLGDPTMDSPVPTAAQNLIDQTQLDMIADGVVRLVMARAAVLQAPKEDQFIYPRVLREYTVAQDEYQRTVSQRAGGLMPLSRFKKPRGYGRRF